MLVDQDDANVLSILCELIERGFNGGGIGLAVHDEEVLLGIGACRDMLFDLKTRYKKM